MKHRNSNTIRVLFTELWRSTNNNSLSTQNWVYQNLRMLLTKQGCFRRSKAPVPPRGVCVSHRVWLQPVRCYNVLCPYLNLYKCCWTFWTIFLRTDFFLNFFTHTWISQNTISNTGNAGVHGNERADTFAGMADIASELTLDLPTVLSLVKDFLSKQRMFISITPAISKRKWIHRGSGTNSDLRGSTRRLSNKLLMQTSDDPDSLHKVYTRYWQHY